MYGITGDDIYNFDETGFQMGVFGTAKIGTSAEREGRAFLKQPGNPQRDTVVEAVNSSGWNVPPMVILARSNMTAAI
ncbi:hypothetical protein LIPSTDRAFT_71905 [Lipomyces starkeyi NRRL Y-11557]|uniref:DDE-1 domain-containing protein n=1 Tax=Lipomyces starkeyi NRRL Y-11557 TaxID=675824 RepID=A0A1E3Q5F0_LIPST|nr:hypothetical protein LIPSTDRAFT_71905 [Lipomyces starkeyi NRRL Y-11557]